MFETDQSPVKMFKLMYLAISTLFGALSVSGFLVDQGPTSQPTTNDVTISATPPTIYASLSTHLVVNCSFLASPGSDFSEVMSIIVSKTAGTDQDVYSEVAIVTSHSNDKVEVKDTSLGAMVKGHLPEHGDFQGHAYLSLEWRYPGQVAEGNYKCQAYGMDKSGHPRVSSDIASVSAEQEITMDILVSEIAELHKTQDMLTSRLNHTMDAIFATSSQYGGHHYFLSKTMLRDIVMHDALCRQFGAYLVEINDQAEYDFVYDFAMVQNGLDKLALGATDIGHEGNFTFLYSGNPVVFIKRGDGFGAGPSDNCMEIWTEFHGYVDEPCYGPNNHKEITGRFLCEM